MTKKHLAEQILQSVENGDYLGNSREVKLEMIKSFLDTLEPKNLGQFANWGYPEQKSTPKECWK